MVIIRLIYKLSLFEFHTSARSLRADLPLLISLSSSSCCRKIARRPSNFLPDKDTYSLDGYTYMIQIHLSVRACMSTLLLNINTLPFLSLFVEIPASQLTLFFRIITHTSYAQVIQLITVTAVIV